MNCFGKTDCRHIRARPRDGIGVHNFYVSAGGDITLKNKNLKFLDKLQFIKEIAAHLGISRDHIPGDFTPTCDWAASDRERWLDYEWFNHELC